MGKGLLQLSTFGGVITDPRLWASAPGYEFWFVPGHIDLVGAMADTNEGLSGHGWTYFTAPTITDGSAGDFLSAADLTPTRLSSGASQGIASPRIFGSYDHALQASKYLGSMPTKLSVEFYAAWTLVATNQTTAFLGLCAPAVTDAVAAGSAGAIVSDATNFRLRSDNGDDAGAAVNTTYHRWRITFGGSTTEWFIDEVSQGTVTTEADIWPVSMKITGASNSIDVAWARVYYEV